MDNGNGMCKVVLQILVACEEFSLLAERLTVRAFRRGRGHKVKALSTYLSLWL